MLSPEGYSQERGVCNKGTNMLMRVSVVNNIVINWLFVFIDAELLITWKDDCISQLIFLFLSKLIIYLKIARFVLPCDRFNWFRWLQLCQNHRIYTIQGFKAVCSALCLLCRKCKLNEQKWKWIGRWLDGWISVSFWL